MRHVSWADRYNADETGFGADWVFRDFVDSPDPRYREIVRMFAKAGYVSQEKDEYE